MSYQVIFSPEAEEDLERLFDHLLRRELDSPTGDLDIAARAIQAVRQACDLLESNPFTCRKAGSSTFVRELIIPFGATGYVAMFEIRDSDRMFIGAIRHQRESDYH